MPEFKMTVRCARDAANALRRECTSTTCARSCRSWDSTTPYPVPPERGRNCVPPVNEKRCRSLNFESGRDLMAKAPLPLTELAERYGPHLNYVPPGGWGESGTPEKLVKTHCCFCGQQCGIQLKVRDNHVTGFEPWEDFPFNRGMLCPKGVKRYLQGSHPDRLMDPLMRTHNGFRA